MTTKEQFIQKVQTNIHIGDVMKNPGRGTSTIRKMDHEKIVYERGQSKLTITFDDLWNMTEQYSGKAVTGAELRQSSPKCFDRKHNGHSCNVTFSMMVLDRLGMLENGIQGKGQKGSPFFATVKDIRLL
ncbi:MAG: hypothetical protein PHY64_06495 [Eubacteriales bacterium]|nr:hypothetical protein [Eubacteriales bacterium]